MIDVDAKVDLRKVQNALRRLQLAGKDLRPVFAASRKNVRVDQRDHAKGEHGPDGKWPALARSTLAKKTRQGKGRRHKGKKKRKRRVFPKMLGRLPRSFDIRFDRQRLVAKSRAKWSGAHQSGAIVGRGSRLPERSFLWASTSLLREIATRALDYLKGAWEKGQ